MLKSTIETPAKPAIFFIVLGVLKGYLKNPFFFLLGTAVSFPIFKKRLPPDFPDEFVKVVAFPAWLYIRLKKRLGQKLAFEIIRSVFLTAGLAVQLGNFRTVEAPRTFENLIYYQQQTNREGPTRWNRMEILAQSDNKYEFSVHNCMFYDFFSRAEIPELTTVMCSVDNAIFNVYLPEEVTFHRNGCGNRIADGAPSCHFVIERHIEG
jgi:hypothetical protein